MECEVDTVRKCEIIKKKKKFNHDIKNKIEIDPFIGTLRKMVAESTVDSAKYNSFIRDAEAKMVDYSDCLYVEEEFNIYENGYIEYARYHDDHFEEYSDGDDFSDWTEQDYLRDYFYDHDLLFINHDVTCSYNQKFFDRYGNEHKTPYFRTFTIEEYRQLDSKLLLIFANYFIEKCGFANWYIQLSESQIEYLSHNLDKIKLTDTQKLLFQDTYVSHGLSVSNAILEKAIALENSQDCKVFAGSECKYPLRGLLLRNYAPFSFQSIDFATLGSDTYNMFRETYGYKLNTKTKESCALRDLANFVLDDTNFSANRLKHFNFDEELYERVRSDLPWNKSRSDSSEGFLFPIGRDSFTRYLTRGKRTDDLFGMNPKTSRLSSKTKEKTEVMDEYIAFHQWFRDNKVDQYRRTTDAGLLHTGNSWDVWSAYQATNDPTNPQLIINGYNEKFARIE